DYLRPGNDNTLEKGLHAVCALRCAITSTRSLPILKWESVYGASCMAIDGFFFERGSRPPPWLREGLAADLQRRICANQVRVYTISYELSDQKDFSDDWAKAMARMIGQNDKMLRPASDVMLMEVIKLPGQYYQQMWSLTSYLNNQAAAQKGPQNKLMRLLCE